MQIKNAHWQWLTLAVVLGDQVTKQLVFRSLDWYAQVEVLPIFNLVHLRNTGVAFSFFAGSPQLPFIILALAVSVFVVWWLRKNPHGQTLVALAFSLIAGGALGNAIDRAFRGYVIDFLDFHWAGWHFPAFNVADIAISIGAGLMILDALLEWRRSRVAGG